MNPTTLTYYIFGGLFFAALIALIVLHLAKKRREQERLDALEAANRSAQPEPTSAAPQAPVMSPIAPVTTLTTAGSTLSAAAMASPYDGAEAAVARAASQATSAAPQTPAYIANWQPPQPKTWAPNSDQIFKVSWANQELFGNQPEDFDAPSNIPKVTPDQVPTTDKSDYAFGTATPAMASLLPATSATEVHKELQQAGYYQPHAMQNLAATRIALMFVGFIAMGVVLLLVPRQYEPIAMGGMFIVPALLWAVPRVRIQQKATNRKSELERSMPDMLDMLNMCVSQGLTIPASLKRIAKDLRPIYPVLASELQIVTHQAEVGSMRVALDNFAERVDVPEVDSFVTLMNQSDRMGTNVSDALTEYSNTMRESLRQRTDEKAGKAAFKLMFPTVLFMMPAVFMFLMGPAILELQRFFDAGGMQNVQNGTNAAAAVQNAQRNPGQAQP